MSNSYAITEAPHSGPSQTSAAPPADLITRLIHSVNTCDEPSFAALFTADAVIHDGGLRYTGPDAAIRWLRESHDRYALRLHPLDISGHHPHWTLDSLVTGTFEGSPVRLDHYLTITHDRISRLEV
jgi:hypothetical protein